MISRGPAALIVRWSESTASISIRRSHIEHGIHFNLQRIIGNRAVQRTLQVNRRPTSTMQQGSTTETFDSRRLIQRRLLLTSASPAGTSSDILQFLALLGPPAGLNLIWTLHRIE